MSIWNAGAFVRWRQRHFVLLCEKEAVAKYQDADGVVLDGGTCNTDADADVVRGGCTSRKEFDGSS